MLRQLAEREGQPSISSLVRASLLNLIGFPPDPKQATIVSLRQKVLAVESRLSQLEAAISESDQPRTFSGIKVRPNGSDPNPL